MGRFVFIFAIVALYFGSSASAETADVTAGLTVLSADRHVDISTQLVKQYINFEIENNDKSPVKYFLFAVDKREEKHLAWIEASVSFLIF